MKKITLFTFLVIFLFSFFIVHICNAKKTLNPVDATILSQQEIADTTEGLKNLQPKLNIPIPTINAFSKATFETKNGKVQSVTIPWLAEYIIGIYNYALILGLVLAVLMIIIGGFLYSISGAKPEMTTKAKKIIIGSLTGLVLLLSSYLILKLVNPEIVNLDFIKLDTAKKDKPIAQTQP